MKIALINKETIKFTAHAEAFKYFFQSKIVIRKS